MSMNCRRNWSRNRPKERSKKVSHRSNTPKNTVKRPRIFSEDIGKGIVNFLKGKQLAQRTIAIAKGCGLNTAKEVNPVLYELHRKEIVTKCTMHPPTWLLTNQSMPIDVASACPRFKDNTKNTKAKIQISPGRRNQPSKGTHDSISHQNMALKDENLFRQSLSDPKAPGAYNPSFQTEGRKTVYNQNPNRRAYTHGKFQRSKEFSETKWKNNSSERTMTVTHSSQIYVNSKDRNYYEGQIKADGNKASVKNGLQDKDSLLLEESEADEKIVNRNDSQIFPKVEVKATNSQRTVTNEGLSGLKNSGFVVESRKDVSDDSKVNDYDDEDDDEDDDYYDDSDSDDGDSSQIGIMSRLAEMVFPQGTIFGTEDMFLEPPDMSLSPDIDLDHGQGSNYFEAYSTEDSEKADKTSFSIVDRLSLNEQMHSMVSPHHSSTVEGRNFGIPLSPAELIRHSLIFRGEEEQKLCPEGRGRGRGLLEKSLTVGKTAALCDSERTQNSVSLAQKSQSELMPWLKTSSSQSVPFQMSLVTQSSSNFNENSQLIEHQSAIIPSKLILSSDSSHINCVTTQELPMMDKLHLRNDEKCSSTFFTAVSGNCQQHHPLKSQGQMQQQTLHLSQNQLQSDGHLLHQKSLHKDPKPALLSTPTFQCFSTSAVIPIRTPLLPDPKPQQPETPANLQINTESFAALNKNPISALMEYAQSRRISARIEVLSQSGPPHKPNFLIAAFLGDRRFPGVNCHNKKDGRKDAAEQAIRILIAEGQYHVSQQLSVMNLPESDMTHFDKMAALTHHKFNDLIARIPESFTGRKVIAGLIIKNSADHVGTVIAIGSGNRCITGDQLSLEGNTVNDCHAEIITRRGFMRFLYHQLESYIPGHDHPIFEPAPSGKLRVKSEVTFHLYISTAPCGDGALFSPRDAASNSGPVSEAETEHRPTFTTAVQGVLRTKMEGGEGTIPIDPTNTVQTWDGIVRGERLRTMSCSDKICRWNVLGMQGALLTHFLEPVYLKSLTLGFLYDHGHLSRAVCCRLNRAPLPLDDELPIGYHLNHPVLGRVTACDPPRETQKTKSYSINWALCDDRAELLDGSTGHCHTGIEAQIFSRLSKRNIYNSFKRVSQHFNREDLLRATSYQDAKQMSSGFVIARQAMMRQFEDAKCGKWVSKPVEEEMFY